MNNLICLLVWIGFVSISSVAAKVTSAQLEKCQRFLEIAESDGASVLLEKPEFMRAYEKCSQIIDSLESSMAMSNEKLKTPLVLSESGFERNVLGGDNNKKFRGITLGNIDRGQECMIEFFQRSHFQSPESRITLRSSIRSVSLNEHSIRTIGDCCWVLFMMPNFHGRRILITGSKSLATPASWTWTPGAIKSVRKAFCNYY